MGWVYFLLYVSRVYKIDAVVVFHAKRGASTHL